MIDSIYPPSNCVDNSNELKVLNITKAFFGVHRSRHRGPNLVRGLATNSVDPGRQKPLAVEYRVWAAFVAYLATDPMGIKVKDPNPE